jgi:hypothetical protein
MGEQRFTFVVIVHGFFIHALRQHRASIHGGVPLTAEKARRLNASPFAVELMQGELARSDFFNSLG